MFISPEINVMGKTVDEAVSEIDKYLDDAALSHLEKVTIKMPKAPAKKKVSK